MRPGRHCLKAKDRSVTEGEQKCLMSCPKRTMDLRPPSVAPLNPVSGTCIVSERNWLIDFMFFFLFFLWLSASSCMPVDSVFMYYHALLSGDNMFGK